MVSYDSAHSRLATKTKKLKKQASPESRAYPWAYQFVFEM